MVPILYAKLRINYVVNQSVWFSGSVIPKEAHTRKFTHTHMHTHAHTHTQVAIHAKLPILSSNVCNSIFYHFVLKHQTSIPVEAIVSNIVYEIMTELCILMITNSGEFSQQTRLFISDSNCCFSLSTNSKVMIQTAFLMP